MDRRSILKSLGILPIGLLAPKVVESNPKIVKAQTLTNIFEYKDFRYFWTGWKQSSDNLRIVGQWIAVNPETHINIYSSYPGKSGQFIKGSCFNTTPTHPQHFMEVTCKQEVKDEAKEDALLVLLKEIDNYYNELKNPIKQPEYKFQFEGFKYTSIHNISA